MTNKIVVIVGPTASGKTRLSIDLAKRFNGEIISGDSMQIYKNMDIGTAKASLEERAEVKHHLVDIIEPEQEYALQEFLSDANKCVHNIHECDKIPFIVGGTGLYITSFIDNIKLADAEIDEGYREFLADFAEKEGPAALREMLKEIDPDSYEKFHDNDTKRIIRALEVYHTTGKTITEQNKESKKEKSPYDFYIIGLNYADRELLYKRIEDRVDLMMEKGFVDEVKNLNLQTCSKTARQAIGYKQIQAFLDKQISLAEAIFLIKQESRRYAKRQLTWFRRDKRINWINNDENSYWEIFEHFEKQIEKFLNS